MQYQLRTLLIVLAVAPPLLEVLNNVVMRALANHRRSSQAYTFCPCVTPRIVIHEEDEARLGLDVEK